MSLCQRRLEPLDLHPVGGEPPEWVNSLLTDAEYQVKRAAANRRLPVEFGQSNYAEGWRNLAALRQDPAAPGRRFVEWGCGAGVITCIAARLGFEARGVEIESSLLALARLIADSHAPETRYLCASFKPAGAYSGRYDGMDRETLEFATAADVVYAYPWPAEQAVVTEVFRHLCEPGALLMTYHGRDQFRLRRLLDH